VRRNSVEEKLSVALRPPRSKERSRNDEEGRKNCKVTMSARVLVSTTAETEDRASTPPIITSREPSSLVRTHGSWGVTKLWTVKWRDSASLVPGRDPESGTLLSRHAKSLASRLPGACPVRPVMKLKPALECDAAHATEQVTASSVLFLQVPIKCPSARIVNVVK
jgi:hypothetical protein